MAEYKWSLNSKEKFTCPDCGQVKRFVRYAHNGTGEWFPDETVGVCDRVDSCGHNLSPFQFYADNPEMREEIEGEYDDFIPQEDDDTYNILTINDFGKHFTVFDDILYRFLCERFPEDQVKDAYAKYRIFSKLDYPVFLQYDSNGQLRSGKIFPFNEDAHRTKYPIWLHKYFKLEGFKLRQCLFGEHLLNDLTKKVVVVESEKTALIGSLNKPEYIWVATGGANLLTVNMLSVLRKRDVIILPDLSVKDRKGKTQYRRWGEKMFNISESVNFNSWDITLDWYPETIEEYQYVDGWDYADFVLEEMKHKKNKEIC